MGPLFLPEELQCPVHDILHGEAELLHEHIAGCRGPEVIQADLDGKGGDGLAAAMANPNAAGDSVPVYHETEMCVPDPGHDWAQSHHQWDDGKNDGGDHFSHCSYAAAKSCLSPAGRSGNW